MSDKIQSDKRCPICWCFIKISEFGVHTCSSCPFRCFGEDFPRIATAMELARVTAWDCTGAARKKAKAEYIKAWR